ncbi:MAG: sulfatase [Oscillospiraceae bacterium]|nr:sulfatase [Oscillospiraceae bacterium]
MGRPNVVLMVSHDTGRFYGPYGHATVDQPSFEALAASSVTFGRAFCTTPLCSPARSALTTGRYPHQNGLNGLMGGSLGEWRMSETDRHLACVLKAAGYMTVLCGDIHESMDLFSVGFDEGIHGSGWLNNWNDGRIRGAGADIGAWLDRNPEAGRGRPFYMQIGCGETHRDWEGSYSERGVWKAPYLIDSPDVDAEMAMLQSSCNALDRGLGEVMDAFGSRGLAEDTVFVVTTDHGIDFPRAKGTLFDPGVGVGLFMRHDAGGWRRGVREDALVSHVDVYPTVLEACGVPCPDGLEGRSLLGFLKAGAPAGPKRDAVYLEKTYHDNYDPMRGLRTERHKYVLNFDAQTLYDVRSATAPRYGWFRQPFTKMNREELYDLEADPNEERNLASDPAYAPLALELKTRLARWMRATGDPLLRGPMPSPYHHRVCNEMNALSRD